VSKSFTFAISTDFKNIPLINHIIESISAQTIKDIEILIIGDTVNIDRPIAESKLVKIYDFDSLYSWPPGREYLKGRNTFWIAEKKNRLIDLASREIIVMMHDYYSFKPDFCETISNLQEPWDFCMPHVVDFTGRNSSHWVSYDHPSITRTYTMPYSLDLAKYAYIPGSLWVAKTSVMKNEKISENLVWSENFLNDGYSRLNEDEEFSLRIRSKNYKYIFNLSSVCICHKPNKYGAGPWA